MKYLFLLAAIMQLLTAAQAQQTSVPSFISDSLDNYIQRGMNSWDIPGMAVVIVKDGKVVTMKGYGVKDLETKESVDENTLFLIASNSKLFTGTALAQLEHQKVIDLDDKVTKYIPAFKLYDPTTTELATVRDMLTHRIGTKTFQGDFTFWNSNLSRYGIIRRMQTLKPSGNFRQDYGYCNSCFVVAGEIIPIVTGKPWEVYVFDSILMPLGMNNTHMLTVGIDQRPNVATPYTSRYTGTNTQLPYDRVDNMGAATSMVSSVNDLSKWLMMQLDSGRLNGKRVLDWPVLQKTRDMQIITQSRKSAVLPTNYRGYGLGVYTMDYNGKQLYYHTGGAFGFFTNVAFVPEAKLGIAILTNKDNQSFFEALRLQLLDAYLGVPYTDRNKYMLDQTASSKRQEQEAIKSWQARAAAASAPMVIDVYTGIYSNETYGNLEISKDTGKKLRLNFKSHNNLKATLEYMDGDEWLLTYDHKGYGMFSTKFNIDKGRPVSLLVKVSDFLEIDPYVFVKETK